MEHKDGTVEGPNKELVDTLIALNKANERVTVLEGEVKSIKEAHVAELKAKDGVIQESEKKHLERDAADAKRDATDAKSKKDALATAIMTEAKLPDSVKYETVEGKKVFKARFRNDIEGCENEEAMRARISYLAEICGHAVPISEEKRLDFDATPAIPANGALHGAIFNAFMN